MKTALQPEYVVITDAARRTYDALKKLTEEQGFAPSLRELVSELELNSPAPVQLTLARLKEAGFITWVPGKARTLKILKELP